MKKIIISRIDLLHLSLLRENVSNFIKKCSIKYDSYDNVILDIAPQDHNGAQEYFKKSSIKTLDIDENSKSDFIADICKNN